MFLQASKHKIKVSYSYCIISIPTKSLKLRILTSLPLQIESYHTQKHKEQHQSRKMETTQSSKSSDHPDVPFRGTSHNHAATQYNSDAPQPATIKIPDGRRNSLGEKIPSPVETWKPNFERRQSWKMEDLKREHVISELKVKKDQGMGFTEVSRT